MTTENILKRSCLPEYMVELARVLSTQLSHMQDMDAEARLLLDKPLDPYMSRSRIFGWIPAAAVKALAMMEQDDTNYIFVVDEGRYLGVVTIHSLATALAGIADSS